MFNGWQEVRLDLDPQTEPDVVGSITEIPLKDNAFDAVYCSHTLEHLYDHMVNVALSEFHRVLKQAGKLHVVVPNLQQIGSKIAIGGIEDALYWPPGYQVPVTPLDILYGMRADVETGNEFMAHKTGFTGPRLQKKFKKAGFHEVAVLADEEYNLFATGNK